MLTSYLVKYIGQFLPHTDLTEVCKTWYRFEQATRQHLTYEPLDNEDLLAIHRRYPNIHSLKLKCTNLFQLTCLPWLHLHELELDNVFQGSNIDPVLQLTKLQKLDIGFSIQQEFLDQIPQLALLKNLILLLLTE